VIQEVGLIFCFVVTFSQKKQGDSGGGVNILFCCDFFSEKNRVIQEVGLIFCFVVTFSQKKTG